MMLSSSRLAVELLHAADGAGFQLFAARSKKQITIIELNRLQMEHRATLSGRRADSECIKVRRKKLISYSQDGFILEEHHGHND